MTGGMPLTFRVSSYVCTPFQFWVYAAVASSFSMGLPRLTYLGIYEATPTTPPPPQKTDLSLRYDIGYLPVCWI